MTATEDRGTSTVEFSSQATGTRGDLQGWLSIPRRQPLRAGLVVVHGLGEHADRYRELALNLADCGIAVFAYDQQGHGRSPGRRGAPRSYDSLIHDLHSSCLLLNDRLGKLPVFLLAHSMGGNLAVSYVLRWPHRLSGLILSAPMLLPKNPPGRERIMAAWLTGKLLPFIRIAAPLDATRLTRDPEQQQAILDDPLIHNKVSLHLATQLIAQGRWAMDNANQIKLPTLVMHGEEDPTTDVAASHALCLRVGPEAHFVPLAGMHHDLLHESESQQVLTEIRKWILAQFDHEVKPTSTD